MSTILHKFFGRASTAGECFTPAEVRRRLRQNAQHDPRTAAVHAAASDVGAWTARLGPRTIHDLGRSVDRLPSVVFWFVQGRTADDIGRSLRPLGVAWDAELALDVATCLIADVLNDRGAMYRQARSTGDTRSA